MSLLSFLRRGRRAEDDAALDDEIRAHFAMAVADRVARGESPDEATANARREFGNVSHVKEVTRETWGGLWLDHLAHDLRYARRSLARSPGFTTVAVLTLALGIGATTAMFTVVNGVLLRPLPFVDAGRLYVASFNPPPGPFSPIPGLYDRHFVAVNGHNNLFTAFTTFGGQNVTVVGVGEPVKLTDGQVTDDFFTVFGARAALGRVFTRGAGEADHVAILSDRIWRSRFNADRRVLGKRIDVDGTMRTIIGVMPPTFDYPAGTDFWTPTTIVRREHSMDTRLAVGRIAPGLSESQARERWRALTSHFELPPGFKASDLVPKLLPLKDVIVGDAPHTLLVFGGAVLFVLLIACANVVNLLLMRATTRRREMAVRATLGAGRGRLVRQLLTEACVLSAVSAFFGIAIAYAAVRALLAIAPGDSVPRSQAIAIDGRVLLFTIGLALLSTVMCGLVPALHATEVRLRDSLAAGARTLTGARARVRSLLAVAQIALALVLLIGAVLVARSFAQMMSVPLGFAPEHAFVATIDLPPARYASAERVHQYHAQVLEGLSRLPRVDAYGSVNDVPFGLWRTRGDFTIENGPKLPDDYGPDKLVVSPGYFRAMGMRVVRGRGFDASDGAGAPRVVIIGESVAKKFWPNGDAIGRRISPGDESGAQDWMTIVGIVNDVVESNVASEADPALYFPLAQTTKLGFLRHMSFVVRSTAPTSAVAPEMHRILRNADPLIPVDPVMSLTDKISWTLSAPRFASRILTTFSLIALALAVIGIYGVLAYGVAQRTHEIGVRMALGATPAAVRAMILRRTLVLAVPGLALGIGTSLALTRVLSNFLFRITPTDPITFGGVAAAFVAVALAASYAPARRASRTDPLTALRSE